MFKLNHDGLPVLIATSLHPPLILNQHMVKTGVAPGRGINILSIHFFLRTNVWNIELTYKYNAEIQFVMIINWNSLATWQHSGKDIGKYRLHELKRTLQETRERRFELKCVNSSEFVHYLKVMLMHLLVFLVRWIYIILIYSFKDFIGVLERRFDKNMFNRYT